MIRTGKAGKVRNIGADWPGKEIKHTGIMMNVVSAYGTKVGCDIDEKEDSFCVLGKLVEKISKTEKAVVGADSNDHAGEVNRGDEDLMGKVRGAIAEVHLSMKYKACPHKLCIQLDSS